MAERSSEVFFKVYFGSQTGTAESFAHSLVEEAQTLGLAAEVVDLENFSPEELARQRLAVLVVATTGEGEPTDNAAAFYSWMLDPKTSSTALDRVAFAVFGLGDRSYATFNRMGELTDGALERLGGLRICPAGVGDASGDLDDAFQQWSELLWPPVAVLFGVDVEPFGTKPQALHDPSFHMDFTVAALPPEVPGAPSDLVSRFYFEAERARVVSKKELRQVPTPEEGRSTTGLVLDISSQPMLLSGYSAGGTLELLPENSPAEVAKILPLLGLSEASKPGDVGDLDCCITFSPASGDQLQFRKPFPTPCSLREALTRYCDLRRAPTRRMLTAVLPHLDPAAQGRVSQLLSDRKALALVQNEALGWTQLEFWYAMGVEKLDLATFLLHCPRQRSRSFTVASSPSRHPTELQLCSSLLSQEAPSLDMAVAALRAKGLFPAGGQVPQRSGRRFGLCSAWLRGLKAGDAVFARTRPGMKLIEKDVPLIMVAAGAGVAPFRGFWEELQVKPRKSTALLVFGCQHPDRDWLYRAEMGSANLEVITAFSKVGEGGVYDPSGCCGQYVQEKLRERVSDILDCIQSGGVMYICGSTSMTAGTAAVIAEALPGGEAEVARLRQSGQVVMESWGHPPKLPDIDVAANSHTGINGTAANPSEATGLQLLEAVKNGDRPTVEKLLEAGADANFQAGSRKYTRIGLRQEVGETALHWAALRGDEGVAQLLLNAGADTDLRDQDGKTPLHIAAFNGTAGVSQLLLTAKADPDIQDHRGNSPLHWIILAGGSMRMLRLLLKHNARASLANADGDLPADLAEEQGSETAAALLRAARALAHTEEDGHSSSRWTKLRLER